MPLPATEVFFYRLLKQDLKVKQMLQFQTLPME
ncbi:hypothetical protein swp_3061 [Shewanella piezotolerans WP3]|uniref:Uncharacterized protein n=1 Tax=Shewanella piezotolerans (strain WP3 / JCM 13877) TaxID=225849 RepID=B8CPR6_SHEPW|nr:hypothetical protein swp_3061 [Shewanella piezotolerans WP3]